MPRSQKLIAGLGLAVMAYLVSIQILPQLPEGGNYIRFTPVNMLIGLAVGWVLMGSRAPSRSVSPLTNGLTGMMAVVLWGLGLHAFQQMVKMSMARRFDDPIEAFGAIFEIMTQNAVYLGTPGIVLTLFVGAMITGSLTDRVARRFG
jgi:hypothetical protein